MKLAASNIAWESGGDAVAAEVLRKAGAEGVEIAPTRLRPDPLSLSSAEAAGHRRFWEERGLPIVALQALLFGRPDLTVFESMEKRGATLEYLKRLIGLGDALGARVLVFGSPKNRKAGPLPPEAACDIALPFFHSLGEEARRRGMVFCIEPNPKEYGCDFINTSAEALALVLRVGSPGFGVHLDAGAMTLSGEALPQAIQDARGHVRHFHASEKNLAMLGAGTVPHEGFARALRSIRYDHWVSVEMRAAEAGGADSLSSALGYAKTVYGDAP